MKGNGAYKVYKFFSVLITVFMLPVLLLGVFCGMVLLNYKANGGYSAIFGYTVVEMVEGFEKDGTPKAKENALFKKVVFDELKVGDIVVYYSTMAEGPKAEAAFDFSSGQTKTELAQKALNSNLVTSESYAEEKVAKSAVSMGVVRCKGTATIKPAGQEAYPENGLAISDSLNNQTTINILYPDVIGIQVAEASPIIIEMLTYCSQEESFLTFILIPCGILLLLSVVSFFFRKGYDSEKRENRKQRIRGQEALNESEGFAGVARTVPGGPLGNKGNLARQAGAGAPQRPGVAGAGAPQRPGAGAPQRSMGAGAGAPQRPGAGAPQKPGGVAGAGAPQRPNVTPKK